MTPAFIHVPDTGLGAKGTKTNTGPLPLQGRISIYPHVENVCFSPFPYVFKLNKRG